MNNKKTLIICMALSIALLFLTFYLFDNILDLIWPRAESFTITYTSIATQLELAIIFSVAVAVSPILLFFTWKLGSIASTKNRTLSILMVSGFMILSVISRKLYIEYWFSKFSTSKTETGEPIYSSMYAEDLNFEYFLLGGLILGCAVSYFIFKRKSIQVGGQSL